MPPVNQIEKVTIEEGVNNIAPEQFRRYTALKEITIPDSVKRIGTYAFADCRSLEHIDLPPYVKNLYQRVFMNCISLKEVNLPDELKYIGSQAFASCMALRELTIPDSVTSFGKDVFCGCEKLHVLHYMGVTIQPDIFHNRWLKVERMLEIIQTGDFSISVNLPAKYHTAGRMYLAEVAPEQTKSYIKAKFPAVFRGLIDLDETEAIEKIISSGEFVSRRNIDKYIEYAIEKGKTEISLILMNYKNEKIGYREPEDLFRL